MFINDNSKLFVNAVYVFDFGKSSIIDFEDGADLDITTRNNFGIGLGYKYHDRVSLEIRYQTPRELLGDYPNIGSNYNTFSVIAGFSVF